jgi:hypothetical protein
MDISPNNARSASKTATAAGFWVLRRVMFNDKPLLSAAKTAELAKNAVSKPKTDTADTGS